MKSGVLHINDVAVILEDAEPFVEPYGFQGPQRNETRCSNGAVGEGAACIKERQHETLPNGVRHSILNISDGRQLDDTGVFTVPADQFFFMGDNRDNSTDSRVPQQLRGVGFVPRNDIVGRADRIMFSSAGRSMLAFWTWRSDRFYKAVE